jgi:uncharacterized membrane protein YesL
MYAMCCLYRFRSHGRVNVSLTSDVTFMVTFMYVFRCYKTYDCSYLQYEYLVTTHVMLRPLTYVSVHLHTVFDYLNMYRNI